MLILSDGPGHRYMSETCAAVCLNLGSVFVLGFKASPTEGTMLRKDGRDGTVTCPNQDFLS